MNLTSSCFAPLALLCAPGVGIASEGIEKEDGPHRGGHHGMRASRTESMDTSQDGPITQEEFTAAHQAM